MTSTVEDEQLTVDYVARACNVSDKTIRRWAKEGHVAYSLGPANRIQIARSELVRLMQPKDNGKT